MNAKGANLSGASLLNSLLVLFEDLLDLEEYVGFGLSSAESDNFDRCLIHLSLGIR